MKTITAIAAIAALTACAGPGSQFAGIGSSVPVHGCGLFDTYTPEAGSILMENMYGDSFGAADSQAGSICNEDVYRARFYRQIESKARVETMPAE